MDTFPSLHATDNGVSPHSFILFTTAPCLTKHFTIASYRFYKHQIMGFDLRNFLYLHLLFVQLNI